MATAIFWPTATTQTTAQTTSGGGARGGGGGHDHHQKDFIWFFPTAIAAFTGKINPSIHQLEIQFQNIKLINQLNKSNLTNV